MSTNNSHVIGLSFATHLLHVHSNSVFLLLASGGLVRLLHDLVYELDKVDGELVAVFQAALESEVITCDLNCVPLDLTAVAKIF
ncbi:unnamed protein product [Protopolystoma xenopodis]|uniref:Uncharacterized protein n=1 Tax=Protopolystoma xenopodis TaxID=117903 RepID=A0A3S5B8W0_9PLAT|nr:unnamed protein product [Protopolystoma xenopodis]